VVEFKFSIRYVVMTNLTHVIVPANNLKHHLARDHPSFTATLSGLGCANPNEEDGAGVPKILQPISSGA
jgi:hypothetical protein